MLRPIIHFLLIHIPMHTCIYINIFMCELYRCMQACIYFLRLTIHGRVSVYIEARGRFQYSPSFELTFSISQCHFWKIDLWPIVNGGSGSKGALGKGGGSGLVRKKNLSSVYCRYLFGPPALLFRYVCFGFGHTFFRWRLWAIDSRSQSCSITKHIDQFLTIHCPLVLL